MKVLVTGAAGFIGSHLTEALVHRGHQVLGIDALLPNLYPSEQKLGNWEALRKLGSAVELQELDLRNPLDERLISDCDYIFHLAAMPGLSRSWEDTKLYIDCNILGTANLIRACDPDRVKRFFHVSTSSVYGKFVLGDETSSLSPISPYGVTKMAAENLLSAYSQANGLSYSIFRLFSVYGPRQRSDMAFNIFTRKLLTGESIEIFGDGTQSRANTYVSDVVEGLISALSKSEHTEIYNLCGNEQATILEILEMLAKITGKVPNLIFKKERLGDQQETKSVAHKAISKLGFTPRTMLHEGLINQVNWQLENAHLPHA